MNFNQRVEGHGLEQALAHNELVRRHKDVAELMLSALSESTKSVSSTCENEMVDEPTDEPNESEMPVFSRDVTKRDESIP